MESPEEKFIRRMFHSYDSDGNGYLDRVEFGKVVKTSEWKIKGGCWYDWYWNSKKY